jgi:hypothetical protein
MAKGPGAGIKAANNFAEEVKRANDATKDSGVSSN